MFQKVFIDSSAWINAFLKGEPNHQQAGQFLFSRLKATDTVFFTSNDVIDETISRLLYRMNFRVANRFWQIFQASIKRQLLTQFWVDEQLQAEAGQLLEKFQQHRLSLTDCTSIALINRFNLDAIFTFDADFAKAGLKVVPIIS